MTKNIITKAMLSCVAMICFGVQESEAQQESSERELQVVSVEEAGKQDDDTRKTSSNFSGNLRGKVLVKVFMPGEIETTDPLPVKIERKQAPGDGRYAHYVWIEPHSNNIAIVPKGSTYQKITVNFREYKKDNPGLENYSDRTLKNKNGGLQEGKVYRIVLCDPTPVHIITQLKGAYACIDDDGKEKFHADDNGTIELKNLAYGDHKVTIYASDGDERGSINIKDEDRVYKLDARRKTKLEIYTNPAGGRISIVEGETAGKYEPTKKYAYGSYKVIAEIDGNTVEKNITVDANHTKFTIDNTRTYNITPMYQGESVYASVFEDNKKLEDGDDGVVLRGNTYQIIRPIGGTYKYYATYGGGKSPKTKVSVSNTSKSDYQLSIAARNSFVWPWEREYDAAPLAGVLGYVRKQMVTTGEGMKLKENGLWPDGEDKWLHGIQVGFYAQPCFSWGLGLHTGLIYEAYLSSTDPVDGYYDSFQEHNITIPVHALYRLPLGRKCAVKLHGGLGFTYAVYGALSAEGYEDRTDFYGEQGFPKRFNMSIEGGLDFRLGPVQVGIQYSKGLTDHGSYSSEGDYKTTCNKIGINIAWVMGVD